MSQGRARLPSPLAIEVLGYPRTEARVISQEGVLLEEAASISPPPPPGTSVRLLLSPDERLELVVQDTRAEESAL